MKMPSTCRDIHIMFGDLTRGVVDLAAKIHDTFEEVGV